MNYKFYEWKIIAIFVLVFIVVQGGSYFAITKNTNAVAIEGTRQTLETGSRVLRNLLSLRASQLSLSTKALASDTAFMEAMDSNVQYQIEPMLRQHLVRLGAAAIIVTDEQHKIFATATTEVGLSLEELSDLNPVILSADLSEREIIPLDSAQQTLFQLLSAPLQIGESAGRLSIAFPLGDPLWQAIGATANTDFMFMLKRNDQAWTSHASTFPAVISAALLDEYEMGNTRIEYYQVGDFEFAFSRILVAQADGYELYAIVGKSIEQVMEPFVRLQKAIFGLSLVALFISVFAVFMVTRRFVAPLNTLAHVDNLTGVANRRLLDLSLKTMLGQSIERADSSFALLMADLDAFKRINDQYGHDAGDIVLQTVARRLLNGVRSSDLVARYGGDEFAVLIGGVNEDGVRQVLNSLLESLRRPIRISEHDLDVGVSIGIAMFPRDGRNVEELQRKADYAMYAAKSLEHRYAFFDSRMAAAMGASGR
jgi:diguanylate cyclase (GGDEF)-like protein